MSVFDKQIHASEFKLRLLLTDGCNLSCPFCLNDYQAKPEPGKESYLDTGLAMIAIMAYCDTVTQDKRQVYFSGGEPTTHRDLPHLIRMANAMGCRTVVNTNGQFSEDVEIGLFEASEIHFGVYRKSPLLADRITRLGGTAQCVYSREFPYVNHEFIQFYLSRGIPVKVFGDMRNGAEGYEEFAEWLAKDFNSKALTFRFAGIQENRGSACEGCQRRCVTLKAAWVFPNGTLSHCPQLMPKAKVWKIGPHIGEWVEAMSVIERSHRVTQGGLT